MPELKGYQRDALDALREYFQECTRTNNPGTAFYTITDKRLGQGLAYRPVEGLRGLPYVCVRIPTGGGKTVVACHAVGLATQELLHALRSVVVWLAPSNTIVRQTLVALRDRRHFYRQALEAALGPITVLEVGEALEAPKATLDTETVIIVATLQAFRVEETLGRKVYEQNGALMHHFEGWPDNLLRPLRDAATGQVTYSLANVLRLRSPIVIVDEAHNARTPLSFETLTRLNPACILEFTATPDTQRSPSNVLYTVSAAELKAEHMIKLPVQFHRRENWQDLLADAMHAYEELDAEARLEQQATGEYIRPIMLIQAQPRRGAAPVTVEVVRQELIENHRIRAEEIKEATGENNELYDIPDLKDPKCPVRYIITVQALREGWDCPFAYVLCSVAELRASTAVEQILGRVLRMPNATKKQRPALNRAYAFATSASFKETAEALADALIENGFNRQEAADLIAATPEVERPPMLDTLKPTARATFGAALDVTALPPETAAKLTIEAASGQVVFAGAMTARDHEAIAQQLSDPRDQAALDDLRRETQGFSIFQPTTGLTNRPLSPAERGETLAVPVLAYRQGELLEPFEQSHFTEVDWNLANADAALTEAEFASTESGAQTAEIDVTESGKVKVEVVALQELRERQMTLDLGRWDTGQLILWLERHIAHIDLDSSEVGRFLERMLRALMMERGLSLDYLVHHKLRLRQAAEQKINGYRQTVYRTEYNQIRLLKDEQPLLEVSPELVFTFDPQAYGWTTLYQGSYQFQKHYYPQVGNLRGTGEEYECALRLDQTPEVAYWVRNVERKNSFWLQTSTDKFYPDFVCQLTDGRYLVVEYKGEDRADNKDSTEKETLGLYWAARSKGRCVFVMVKDQDWGAIRQAIAV
ncbi:MAG: DEAD/DEAH box helicase family protein [Anaerolineales bacterium]|nr:DEAD/DEAH box helicase family protein [Anaerolineales bacterium]